MYIQKTSFSVLGAVTLLTYVSTALAGHIRHHHRPRQAAGMTEVPTGELSLLESEMTTFRGWMEAWFDSTATADPGAAVAQLKEEFAAYDSWMSAWLNSTIGINPAPSPIFASVPLPVSQHSSLPPKSAETSVPLVIVTLSSVSVLRPVMTTPSVSASSGLYSQPSFTSLLQSTQPSVSVLPNSIAQSSTVASPGVASTTSVSNAAPAPLVASNPGGSGGSFNAGLNSNVAVYYGQTAATSQVSLAQMCQDPNVNIIILAFLTQISGPGGYPTVNFASACGGNTPAQNAKGATGLLSCPKMATDIITCQGLGKKVMLSLGGAQSSTAFSSASQAQAFATQLWNLFGAGKGEDSNLRPFGNVVIDGFDIGESSSSN